MNRYYSLRLGISPFLVGPIASLGSEAAFAFAPAHLASNTDSINRVLYGSPVSEPPAFPINSHISRFMGGILAVTNLATPARSTHSSRPGQLLSLGVWMLKKAPLYHKALVTSALILLRDFLESIGGASLHQDGAERLVKLLQSDSVDLNAMFADLTSLLVRYHVTFALSYKEGGNIASKARLEVLYRTFLAVPRYMPGTCLDDALRYWKYVDERLDHATRTVSVLPSSL